MAAAYKIFAYGSLLNQASLKKTVPEARDMFPAKVYGFHRVFNLASSHRYDEKHNVPVCVLNAEPGENRQFMNGACFEMDEVSLNNLLKRERGYEFCEISAHHYNDEKFTFQAYVFRAKNFQPYQFLSKSKEQKHYLDLCLTGSKVFGRDFLEDFKRTTSFWGIDCKNKQQSIWFGDY